MIRKNVKILDCTFRDGGYYTNWNFDHKIVNDYLKLYETGISDIVEIGLRTINSPSYLGPFAYTSYDYFFYCREFKNLKFSTLVNWNDISNSFKEFEKLFPGTDIDFITIVRIVIKSLDLSNAKNFIEMLKYKGYKVCLNIQNCDQLIVKNKDYLNEKISFFNPDIFYLADTNGNLVPSSTKKLIKLILSSTNIPIGVHLHNNQGLALANALEAIESGATYIDSTLTGIGRGAGNTQTEYLSYYLRNLSLDQITSISKIIEDYFLPLKKEYLWGENYLYFLSGFNNQSASLIHDLMNNKTYSRKSLLKLANSNQNDSLSKIVKENENQNNYIMNQPDAIIIANGSDWLIEKDQIMEYLNIKKLETMHINYPNNKDAFSLIDIFCSCDPVKIINDFDLYKSSIKIPLICPNNIIQRIDIDPTKLNINSYGCNIVNNNFHINSSECTIPSVQSLCYGLAYFYSKGYRNILLIGVQGFKEAKKNYEAISSLNLLNIKYPDLQITSICKNNLGIKSKSIFEIRNIK